MVGIPRGAPLHGRGRVVISIDLDADRTRRRGQKDVHDGLAATREVGLVGTRGNEIAAVGGAVDRSRSVAGDDLHAAVVGVVAASVEAANAARRAVGVFGAAFRR